MGLFLVFWLGDRGKSVRDARTNALLTACWQQGLATTIS